MDDLSQVIVEIDTKQSDFVKRDYKTFEETFVNNEEKAYADYLLLDSKGDPLAIIEAKKTSKDPITGQRQAEGYADDIKKQTDISENMKIDAEKTIKLIQLNPKN